MKRLVTSIAVALVGLTLAAPASATGSTAPLPLSEIFEMVLDEDAGHIYFTAGEPYDILVVTDLAGSHVTTVTGLEGASGMSLDGDGTSLFVALPTASAVARIDLATLAEVERFNLPADVCPGSVAVTAGYLAIGHSCNQYAGSGQYGGVGILDPASGAWNPLEAPGPFYQPYVSSAPGSAGLFVTGDLGLSPVTLYTIGIADGIGDTVASLPNSGSNLRDLAMSPDGALVVQAAGSPYRHDVFDVAGLNPVLTYETTNYPNAAAWSADGSVVATGTDSPYDDDVRVHLRDAPLPFASFELGARLAARGLAISADGSTAFAVSEASGAFTLHILPTGPVSVASTVAFDTPGQIEVGNVATLTGALSFANGADASGQVLSVTRSYADVVEALPPVTTAAGGAFSLVDLPEVATTITYTAAFAGDGVYQPSSGATELSVVKRSTDLTIDAVKATGKKNGGKVAVTAELDATYTNRVVTITATDNRGSRVIANGAVGADGKLTVNYRVRRTTTFTADFAGDAWYLPAMASTTYVK